MEKKTVFVVGLGRFGQALCERLVALGQHVIGVDKVRARVEEMADALEFSAQLDASDEEALVKAGAKEADVAVVAIGENLEASVLATAILRGMEIPLVVARAQTKLHARVLAKVGAHKVIFPERDMGIRVAEFFVHPWLSKFSTLPGTDFLVGSVHVLPEMVGRSLSALSFRKKYSAVVLLVERNGNYFIPEAETVLETGDSLLVAGKQKDLERWVAPAFERGGQAE